MISPSPRQGCAHRLRGLVGMTVPSVSHFMRTCLAAGAFFCLSAPLIKAFATTGSETGQPAIIGGTGRVVDGDTLDVGTTRVRLEGIDAPEIAQTCQNVAGASWNC